jgi:hypothetical protein
MLALLSMTACSIFDFRGDTDCQNNPAAAWAVSLPPSASNVEERCSMNIVNPSYTVFFTMSPNDLETFQQSTPIASWSGDVSVASTFGDQAAQMESLLVGSYGDGAVLLEVLIDTSDPQQYRVYCDATFVD